MRLKKPTPFLLPSNYTTLQGYLRTHKKELYDHVIYCLKYLKRYKNVHDVTVFSFDDSKYTISISNEDIKENVEWLYSIFLETENYELCDKIVKLRNQYANKEKCGK